MGLISKIEDKISGNKSSTNENQYTESNYNDSNTTGTASKLRHPISSSEPTGTAVPTSTSVTHGPTTTTTSTGTTSHGTTSALNRDGYGQQGTTQQQGAYGSSTTDRAHANPATSNVPGSNERQYYDPYSRKGQQTAASASQDYGMNPSTTSNRYPHEDAGVARGQQGGVLNSTTGRTEREGYSHPSHEPGSIHTGSHINEPSSTSGGHHYGRDATAVGGVGAGGVGAYELGKHSQQSSQAQSQNFSHPQERDVSYMNRSDGRGPIRQGAENPAVGGATGPLTGGHRDTSDTAGGASALGSSVGEPAGLTQAKKMGGAYEAGYKDGMEHMRAEMQREMQRGSAI